jgi:hypothetical protein
LSSFFRFGSLRSPSLQPDDNHSFTLTYTQLLTLSLLKRGLTMVEYYVSLHLVVKGSSYGAWKNYNTDNRRADAQASDVQPVCRD